MSKVLSARATDQCRAWEAPLFSQGAVNPMIQDGEPPLLTREQQQELQQQAFDQAVNKGFEAGQALARQELDARVARLDAIMRAIQAPFEELDNQVVDEMVTLCMAVVRQMVRRELKISPGEIVAVVREAISLLPVANGDITLSLHPEDAQIVRDALLKAEASPAWRINEDPLLSRGGCLVSTQTSRIDATVESRLNAAIAAVMGCERRVDSQDDDE